MYTQNLKNICEDRISKVCKGLQTVHSPALHCVNTTAVQGNLLAGGHYFVTQLLHVVVGCCSKTQRHSSSWDLVYIFFYLQDSF